MIGFITLIIFMFVSFGLTTLFRRRIDVPTLIAVAIGAAVNANLYTTVNNPIPVGNFVFSMEMILSTLFTYTIIVRILDYGYKEARNMTFTTIAAIIISAVIEFAASCAFNGYSIETLKTFSYYVFSCIGTIIGVWVMISITINCRKRNLSSYLIIPFALIPCSIIHSLFYYGGIALVEQDYLFDFYKPLSAAIAKIVCIALATFCYFINKKYWVPKNLIKQNIKETKDE